MYALAREEINDRRREIRYQYSRYVLYATKNRLYQGELRDYSLSGLFIMTNDKLPVGEIITVALPYSTNRNDKRKGQIVRSDIDGFGVEFFSNPEERIMRKDLF